MENECGSGGCQQSAGDFLFHCHVAQHYFAGMWGIWRVYNTLQDGVASTDPLPALAELADRRGRVRPAVSAEALIGRRVEFSGPSATIDGPGLAAWVERQLPPAGVPRGYDASVLDWIRDGDRYLGEPETDQSWPGYQARAPGSRPVIVFDPLTGKLAYPLLKPHLGKRPPFAPNHGPAPFLDPVTSGTDLPRPGANGPASVCPAGTRTRSLALQAISLSVALNPAANIVDSSGALFVLKEQEDAVRADDGRKTPLAVRANAGEDCVDVLLRSELADASGANAMSKVSAHIHFVQFDVQASPGRRGPDQDRRRPRSAYAGDGLLAGDPVKVHVLAPWSEQAQVFSIEGHRWPFEPGRDATDLLSSVTVGGMEAITLELDGGAGGAERLAGDYTYGNHRLPYREAGQWGVFRVRPAGVANTGAPLALPSGCGPNRRPCLGRDRGSGLAFGAVLTVLLLGGLIGLGAVKRRRNAPGSTHPA